MSSLNKLSLKNQVPLTFIFKTGMLSIGFLFSFSVWGFYKIKTLSEEDKAASYAIWSIKDNNNYYGLRASKMGTAFFISPTQVMTAFHVIDSFLEEDELSLEDLVLTHHNLNQVISIKKILHLSKFYDLAVLEVDAPSSYFLNLVEEASPLDNGLYVMGYYRNGHNKEGEFGKFKQTGPLRDLDYGEMTVNHSNLKGVSGGPVLLNSQIRGVVSINFKNLLNFISVNDVRDFLKEDGFSCYNSSAKECLKTAKELFIKNPKQDLKYYYNLLQTAFVPEMIHAQKTEEEKKQFWNEFETAVSGLENMKEQNNNPLLFYILSEYYRFNSYRFSSSESDKISNNFKKRFDNIKRGALAGSGNSQYILSYLKKADHRIPSSYPLLYSNNSYWLLKAGQSRLSEAQYELGKTYYRYHQNPFLNDFILKSVLYEESLLLEKMTDTAADASSDLTQPLIFDPSLNFKTKLLQSLNPDLTNQAKLDFFQKAKFYKSKNVSFYDSASPIDITPLLKKLSNPYNPYQENLNNQSDPYQTFSNPTPLKNKILFDEAYFYKEQNWLGLNPEKINFSLFENDNQKKSLLAPEDQQFIKSYQDLITWIFDKEKSFYKEMDHIGFYEKLSQFTGCYVTKKPPIYKLILTDHIESRVKYRQTHQIHSIHPLYSPYFEDSNKSEVHFSIYSSFESPSEYKLSASLNFLLGKYWLIKAGEQGHAEAQYLLAELYAKNKNRPLAEYWLLKSLNQKDKKTIRRSFYLLGLIYANIKEVDKKRNTCLARFWFRKAGDHQDYRAENALKKIAKEETAITFWKGLSEAAVIAPWEDWSYEETVTAPWEGWSYEETMTAPWEGWSYEETHSHPDALQYFAAELPTVGSIDFFKKTRNPSPYMSSIWSDEELILFNKKTKGEFLIDRNSPLLDQYIETEFYEFFDSRESLYKQSSQWQSQDSLGYNSSRIEMILSSLYKSKQGFLNSSEIIKLENFLKHHPETIYQIAEESSLLWSDKKTGFYIFN